MMIINYDISRLIMIFRASIRLFELLRPIQFQYIKESRLFNKLHFNPLLLYFMLIN
jgi:hypothetical protein